jgi:CHAT domain-containing protein
MIGDTNRFENSKPREGTALVSFYLNNNETLIFWLDENSPDIQVERASVGREDADLAAAKLRRLFSRENINYSRPEHTTNMSWLEPLGHKLLQPLVDRLDRCAALIVAPHGELHSIPLHLLTPEGGAPLGTTHSISYVPNLSLYALLISRSTGSRTDLSLPSLCLATAAREDPEQVRQSFSMTPRSYSERTGGIFLEGNDATWSAFRRYAESAASIYLSCHGYFDYKDSLASTLLLSDGLSLPSRMESKNPAYELSVRDILELRIRSRLVILDACMSGIQHFSQGDEPMGFPTAFLLSGAGAVVASNWIVEQNCARAFMLKLQECWSSGASTLGQSMQQAYRATRSEYLHPFHWAAFSLFGNDRLLFS